jgi:hypothetical protein
VIAVLLGASVVASLMVPPPANASPEAAAHDPEAAARAGGGLVTLECEPMAGGDDFTTAKADRAVPGPDPVVSADRRPD